ncbi:MAG: DUF58 domain-containing protein [Pseudomonadota bacterium]
MASSTNASAALRRDAEKISGSLPPLLVEADRLVSTLVTGAHGRKRSGIGETFWQYRPAHPGDSLGQVDWRRSAKSDRLFVREMEWEAAESTVFWCDRARSMDFKSDRVERTKAERAQLLTLATAVLMHRGGERFGLLGTDLAQPRGGETQLMRMAATVTAPDHNAKDFGAPPKGHLPKAGKAVFFSDFMGPRDDVFPALLNAAGQGTGGVFVMILDPVEEEFPFHGRIRFESVARAVRHETDEADSLRQEYLARLAERRDDLDTVARRAGWHLILHRTDESPRKALVALHGFLGGGQ